MKLHQKLLALRQKEKQITSEILEVLQSLEDQRGYLKLGYSSLFDYLVRGLGYSESTAYQRQSCLRLSREIPEVKEKIDSGALTFSTVTAAYKHIKHKPTAEKRQILAGIENKSSREVKKLFVAPAKPIKIKKQEFQDKILLRLELTHIQNQKLERLKALKSHKHNLESLFEEIIDKELAKYENKNNKIAKNNSKNPRYIPRRLRNSVLKRADFKCQHPGCEQDHYLQIDHIIPVRKGGRACIDNLQVLCAAHNKYKG